MSERGVFLVGKSPTHRARVPFASLDGAFSIFPRQKKKINELWYDK